MNLLIMNIRLLSFNADVMLIFIHAKANKLYKMVRPLKVWVKEIKSDSQEMATNV